MKPSTLMIGAIFFLGIGYMISGALYGHFCTDKILAREQYLADVAQQLTPPAGAVKMSEEAWRKGYSMSYFVDYQYEQSANGAMAHYAAALKEQGYAVDKRGRYELDAKKKDIVVKVVVDQSRKMIYVKFGIDDIFGQLHI